MSQAIVDAHTASLRRPFKPSMLPPAGTIAQTNECVVISASETCVRYSHPRAAASLGRERSYTICRSRLSFGRTATHDRLRIGAVREDHMPDPNYVDDARSPVRDIGTQEAPQKGTSLPASV